MKLQSCEVVEFTNLVNYWCPVRLENLTENNVARTADGTMGTLFKIKKANKNSKKEKRLPQSETQGNHFTAAVQTAKANP